MPNISLYFSRIQGNKIHLDDGTVIGKLIDIGVTLKAKNPMVVALKVKTPGGIKYYEWKSFDIAKKSGQYYISCSKPIEINISEDVLFLYKYILDKQIIDVNGRKVVRVNDLRLILLKTGFYVIAVDIGAEGILRRLGLAKPLKGFLKLFNIKISSRFILWNDVETIAPSNASGIMLSKTYEKLYTMRPSDIADIIEDIDANAGAAIFSSLDNAKAADVLEEMESDVQVTLLKSLSRDRAADILEEMPADEVADILDGLDDDEAEELLKNMESDASTEIRELMEYEDDRVGSLMTTDFICFKDTHTVDETLRDLRNIKPDEDTIYYLYIVDNKEKLTGVVSIRSLVISEPSICMEDIMDDDPIYVYDTDSVDSLIKIISKYNLLAVPVVDMDRVLVGTVIINDIVYELIKSKRIRA